MRKNQNNTTGRITCVQMVGLATLVTILCLLLSAMLLTTFVVSGSLEVKTLDIGATTAILISTLIGSMFIKKMKGEGRGWLTLCYLLTIVILLILINITTYGAEFNSVLMKLAVITLGGVAGLVDAKGKGSKRNRYRKR